MPAHKSLESCLEWAKIFLQQKDKRSGSEF